MKRFASRFRTYEEWSKHAMDSGYSQRIRRRHFLYPKASLGQLAGRPSKGEKPLQQLRRKQLWQLLPSALSARQKRLRLEALEVISKMRGQGAPLSMAIAGSSISKEDVLTHAGGALYRRKGADYRAKPADTIPRAMKVNVNGVEIVVIVDSENATIIGEYHNAKKKFLDSGDVSVLTPFTKATVRDIFGEEYRLDSDPKQIIAVEERREQPEFYSVYHL